MYFMALGCNLMWASLSLICTGDVGCVCLWCVYMPFVRDLAFMPLDLELGRWDTRNKIEGGM